jgi:hypothetical protein
MAVINSNTLVLLNVSVLRDVVNGTKGTECATACAETLAMPFSLRQPSQRYPGSFQEPSMRPHHADDGAADRAGRPGCVVGALTRRGRALRAARTTLAGWLQTTGSNRLTGAWRSTCLQVEAPAAVGAVPPGRSLAFYGTVLPTGRFRPAGKRGTDAAIKAKSARLLRPAVGAPLVATW